jgi:pyruvate/2-oxoglutarate dehydrogenase complex dihydrolipoamide acyltransferase (E2) component
MPLRERSDGASIEGLGNLRRMMPYLMPTRNEAYVLLAQEIDSAPTRALADRLNAERSPDRPVTQFHMLLRGLTKVFAEFPRMNRFVVGGRHYDRDGIWIAFSAKMRLDANAPVFARKMRFAPEETLLEMVDRIFEVLDEGRSGRESASDREVHAILRLPGPLRRLVVRIGRWLDAAGLLPQAMIDNDPLYASAFVANLGSVGLDAAYHHLFEHGTTPIFLTMGRVHRAPYVRDDGSVASREVFELKFTFDERTEDGFYAARGLERLKHLLEHPAEL